MFSMEWSEWVTATIVAVVTIAIVLLWLRRKSKSKSKDKNQSKTSQESPPSKEPVTIHDIVSLTNGNEAKEVETYTNKAFKDDIVAQKPVSLTKEVYRKTHPARTISDVSELFRPPDVESRSLSVIVIEEFDHKSKSLHNDESGDISAYRTNDKEGGAPIKALTGGDAFPDPNLENNTHAHKDSSSGKEEEEAIETRMKSGEACRDSVKSTEWRDKLKQDLLDDDEEFMEDSSDSETSTSGSENMESGSEMSVTDGTDTEGRNARGSQPAKKTLISQSSFSKLVEERAVVIDNGSHLVRGGLAGDFTPAFSVRNVIGHWRAEASEAWQEALGSKFIGQSAIDRHSTLAMDYPIEDGKIINWKGIQEVWDHVINKQLEVDFTQHPLIMTEPVTVEKKQREKVLEIMIESLRVPGVCLRPQAVMCAMSSGHKVGLVISSGSGTTEVVPVYEGYQLSYATRTLGVGGRDITDYLIRLAQREHGLSFTSVAEIEIINSIKEKHAKVLTGYPVTPGDGQIDYQLPDGQVIQLCSELTHCTEAMFKPGLVGSSSLGLTELIKQSLESIDQEIMSEADNTILLAGGNSKLSGFKARLEEEIHGKLGRTDLTFKQTTCDDHAAWVGASIFAQQPAFLNACITEDMYFEHGAKLVHTWCI